MHISYLFTPALKIDALRNGANHAGSLVVIDLEDAVHANAKQRARDALARCDLQALGMDREAIGIRINSLSSLDGLRDIELLRRLGSDRWPIAYVFLPKLNNVQELQLYRTLLSAVLKDARLVSIIETVDAVENVDAIAAASDALILGQADLVAEMYSANGAYLAYARARLCIAAARYGIMAIDTNSFELNDMAILRQECLAAKQDGFVGKAIIHPRQAAVVKDVFTVSAREVDQYRDAIACYDSAPEGFAIVDGKVIAPPFIAKARKMLAFFERNGLI